MSDYKKEQVQTQARLQALFTYTKALEQEDYVSASKVLESATSDSVLERMIIEMNEVYQLEDQTHVHADDVTLAQEMLLSIFAKEDPEQLVAPSSPTATSSVVQNPKQEPVGTMLEYQKQYRQSQRLISARTWYQTRRNWGLAIAAVALIAIMLAPGTGALAAQFFSLFQVQQVQPVNLDHTNPRRLVNDLSSLLQHVGDQQVYQPGGQQALISPAAQKNLEDFKAATHFPVQVPTYLPANRSLQPGYNVITSTQMSYVFNMGKAKDYLKQTGQSNIPIPGSLDNATFTLKMDQGVLINYCPTSTNNQTACKGGFSLTELPNPVLEGSGKTILNDLLSFLLSLPKLLPDQRTVLEHIDINTGTIPVPIPTQVSSHQVTIKGHSALLLNVSSANLLFWQANNIVYSLSSLDTSDDELIQIASSLH